jgi:hypothetical protein|uniref:Uncharacterized protein n=1 Tax=Picea glauca TaxID=3330 RepID=A0A101M475_PICGL|nr:hypothetical protein ABT39_MTgene441 [Picea glauca]QHR88202.1 hypothetical protein Q903MT_gene2215 [Picea sitchensis]
MENPYLETFPPLNTIPKLEGFPPPKGILRLGNPRDGIFVLANGIPTEMFLPDKGILIEGLAPPTDTPMKVLVPLVDSLGLARLDPPVPDDPSTFTIPN